LTTYNDEGQSIWSFVVHHPVIVISLDGLVVCSFFLWTYSKHTKGLSNNYSFYPTERKKKNALA
jgi:hypothetical protein